MADMESSTFIANDEWTDYLNREAAALHSEFVEAFEDYYTSQTTFTLSAGTNTLALPADFWKIRGVDYQIDAGNQTWREVRQFQFNRRNDLTPDIRRLWGASPERRYRVFRDALWIVPESDASGTYRLWYVTLYQPMVADADAIPDWEGFHELVILGAAIRALDKQESVTDHLKRDREMLRARIAAAAQNRNAGEPEVVQDVQSLPGAYPYGGGFSSI